jgi:hypothetical protein
VGPTRLRRRLEKRSPATVSLADIHSIDTHTITNFKQKTRLKKNCNAIEDCNRSVKDRDVGFPMVSAITSRAPARSENPTAFQVDLTD